MRLETGIGGIRSLIDASPEWWEEKIKVDKDFAKFKGANLEIFETHYAPLFRDSVATGDQAMTPSQFLNDSNPSDVQHEENIEGKGDSDDISLGDDETLFSTHIGSSSSKRKKNVSNKRATKSKTSSFEEKLDVVLDALSTKSTETFPPTFPSPTIEDCMDIVTNYNDDVPAYILNNSRYYPMFKDCIGAIDGTHVRASVPLSDQPKYIGRKGYATQNIMAVCDFDMCFTFVWAGWEGTAHDTRIFNEALQRPELHFPHPMGDKYYVVDAGYPNTKGYLAPYKGAAIRYHLPDFQRGETSASRAPRGPKETFNYRHSSLRNIIERTFGVWKGRWALLRDMHINYTYEHQVSIVIASMAIHNFIRKGGRFDEAFKIAQQESYNPTRDEDGGTSNEVDEEFPATHRKNVDAMYMAAIRDIIAQDIMTSGG